jgi:hypothetical protein
MKFIVVIVLLFSFYATGVGQKTWKEGTAPVSEKAMIRFYPNPATSIINFEFKIPVYSGYTLQVFSFLGRKVLTVLVTNTKTSVNNSELNRGIYVFQLRDTNGRIVESNKFQVNK